MFSSMPANINDAFTTSMDYNKKPKLKKNKTIKMKQNEKNEKVEQFLSSLRQSFSDSEDENESPQKMLPFPEVQSQKAQNPIEKQKYNSTMTETTNPNRENDDDGSVSKEEFTNYLDPNNTTEHFQNNSANKWIPYFTETNGGQQGSEIIQPSQQTELINKLNYLIHMIETEKSQKTGHVTEELILYSFLGVFMIFIVDSFTKVSKYSR